MRLRAYFRDLKLTMRMKLTLSLCSIAIMLLVSSFISIMEYSRMSNYVTRLMSGNIASINIAQSLAEDCESFNHTILAFLGDSTSVDRPTTDVESFISRCDSLKSIMASQEMMDRADTVAASYSAYIDASSELDSLVNANFEDTRMWYLYRLRPLYTKLIADISALDSVMHTELRKNSATFERGFYRSIIPGAVAVAVGLLLILMLLFFLMVYYVNPIYRMLKGLDNYRSLGTKYNYSFDGDDQLAELNTGITELAEENMHLRKRLKDIKDKNRNPEERI